MAETEKLFSQQPVPIALVDCDNFFVSCERVFQPSLRQRPVVVLSSNDGCVISRSNDVKNWGVPMGAPAFQYQHLFDKHNVAILSANFGLYSHMSRRVNRVLAGFGLEHEVYSIDEAFLTLPKNKNHQQLGQQIVAAVGRATGIPVSVGVAPTKTLAKVATRFAKNQTPGSVSFFDQPEAKIDQALKQTDIQNVWGVGRRLAERYRGHGLSTAYGLKQVGESWVRRHCTVATKRTIYELQGLRCLQVETESEPNQTIQASRSFGQAVTSYEQLKQAVAYFTAQALVKLRRQGSLASRIQVYVAFGSGQFPAHRNDTVDLPQPSADTSEFVAQAWRVLSTIYRPNVKYKKAGVVISKIVNHGVATLDFAGSQQKKDLMQTMDRINQKWGAQTAHLLGEGTQQSWQPKQAHKSQDYTASWQELPKVKTCSFKRGLGMHGIS